MNYFFKCCSLLLFFFITSCQTFHPLSKYNYFDSSVLYNDPLKIRFKYFGDIDFYPLSEIKKKDVKNLIGETGLKTKELIAYGSSSMNPEYRVLLFVRNAKNTDSQPKTVDLVFKDTVKKKVVYRKLEGGKFAYLFLQAINSNSSVESIIQDGANLIKSLSLTSKVMEKLTFSKVFASNKGNPNPLYVRKQLLEAPVPLNQENEWMRFQYLITVNSFISNNDEYDALLENFEHKRQKLLRPILDTVFKNHKIKVNHEVFDEVANLAADTRVVMLNENHWYPKHRLYGLKLLKILRQKGYTHLALEALYRNQDSLINIRKFPVLESGYYTREVYFGHFIRRAKELGFTIIGYENQDQSINRELGQAKNLVKTLEENIDNKIFVYGGLDHIIEEPIKKGVYMAGYLKEMTNIDPLTINQVDIISKGKNKLTLIPFNLLQEKEKFQKPVDYYVINNLEPTPDQIYGTVLQQMTIEDDILDRYTKVDLLVNIYNLDEYLKFRSRAIPIQSVLKKVSEGNSINFSLPPGNYMMKIFSEKDEVVLLKEIKIKEKA